MARKASPYRLGLLRLALLSLALAAGLALQGRDARSPVGPEAAEDLRPEFAARAS